MPDLGISAALASGSPEQLLGIINAGVLADASARRDGVVTEHGPIIGSLEEPFLQLHEGHKSHRVRGLNTVIGHAMEGGEDDSVAVQLAVANEINQVALVTADDLMDDALLRRGIMPAHRALADMLMSSSKDEDTAIKDGGSLAIVGSMGWQYEALDIICGLAVPAERRIDALSIINNNMRLTGYGQALDIYHSKRAPASLADIRAIMLAKTAIYTVRNPLEVGMAVAGGTETARKSTRGFSDNAGMAFQALNDLDVMNDLANRLIKDPTEDIRGGKQTLLTNFVLSNPDSGATDSEKVFLKQMLCGKGVLDEEFLECQRIFRDSGAVGYVQSEVRRYGRTALDSLQESARHADWNQPAVRALACLTCKLVANV